MAMRRAVEALPVPADYALIDGNRMPPLSIPGETIIKGDALSMSIAGRLHPGKSQPGPGDAGSRQGIPPVWV